MSCESSKPCLSNRRLFKRDGSLMGYAAASERDSQVCSVLPLQIVNKKDCLCNYRKCLEHVRGTARCHSGFVSAMPLSGV
jgi:hypothetical protein